MSAEADAIATADIADLPRLYDEMVERIDGASLEDTVELYRRLEAAARYWERHHESGAARRRCAARLHVRALRHLGTELTKMPKAHGANQRGTVRVTTRKDVARRLGITPWVYRAAMAVTSLNEAMFELRVESERQIVSVNDLIECVRQDRASRPTAADRARREARQARAEKARTTRQRNEDQKSEEHRKWRQEAGNAQEALWRQQRERASHLGGRLLSYLGFRAREAREILAKTPDARRLLNLMKTFHTVRWRLDAPSWDFLELTSPADSAIDGLLADVATAAEAHTSKIEELCRELGISIDLDLRPDDPQPAHEPARLLPPEKRQMSRRRKARGKRSAADNAVGAYYADDARRASE